MIRWVIDHLSGEAVSEGLILAKIEKLHSLFTKQVKFKKFLNLFVTNRDLVESLEILCWAIVESGIPKTGF